MINHEEYTELTVGYALDALEPADEQRLLVHLPGCRACERFLDEMREVAGSLAADVRGVDPPAELLDQLRIAVSHTAQRDVAPTSGAELDHEAWAPLPRLLIPARGPRTSRFSRRSAVRRGHARRLATSGRALRLVTSAAAALVLLATGVYAVHVRSDRNASVSALSSEEQVLGHLDNPGAYSVSLAPGGATTGAAIVDGNDVYLLAHDLAVNDRATSQYVLWARAQNGSMIAVTSFDVRSNGTTVAHAKLDGTVSSPQRFAVTHESGRTVPQVPGTPVLGGTSL